jgi:hypothetical protein
MRSRQAWVRWRSPKCWTAKGATTSASHVRHLLEDGEGLTG